MLVKDRKVVTNGDKITDKKKTVFHVGDKIRVLRPKFIERVGYPLVWTQLMAEVKNDPRTLKAWKVLHNRPITQESTLQEICAFAGGAFQESMSQEFLRAVAMLRVQERGFGGADRKIIYYQKSPIGSLWQDTIFTILSKRTAKTGKYYSPSGDDEDFESGGLDECKTHILLNTAAGWIEEIDVELVK